MFPLHHLTFGCGSFNSVSLSPRQFDGSWLENYLHQLFISLKLAFSFVSVFICLYQSLSLSRFNVLSLLTISVYSSPSLSLIICLQQCVCSICCTLVNINVLNFQEHPHIYSALELLFFFLIKTRLFPLIQWSLVKSPSIHHYYLNNGRILTVLTCYSVSRGEDELLRKVKCTFFTVLNFFLQSLPPPAVCCLMGGQIKHFFIISFSCCSS